MKGGRTFTLDIDILMKKPTSKLVNMLLRGHYGNTLDKNCKHDWSGWCETGMGLGRDCRLCGETELRKKENG